MLLLELLYYSWLPHYTSNPELWGSHFCWRMLKYQYIDCGKNQGWLVEQVYPKILDFHSIFFFLWQLWCNTGLDESKHTLHLISKKKKKKIPLGDFFFLFRREWHVRVSVWQQNAGLPQVKYICVWRDATVLFYCIAYDYKRVKFVYFSSR